jgi:hypothetical protein
MTAPQRVNLSALHEKIPTDVDVFVCSASYEERCYSIAKHLDPQRMQHVLVCANEDHLQVMKYNLSLITGHFGERSQSIMLRTDRPLVGADNLLSIARTLRKEEAQTVLVDITTFTHEGVLIVLKLLPFIWDRPADRLFLAYAPASEYAVGLNSDQKWLSQGIRDIRSVLGYPGLMKPARKLHLIVLVGFEGDRAKLLIDSCEPDAISLGKGKDATDARQSHLPKNIDTLRQLSVHYPRFNEFDFSCVDVGATKDAIEQQAKFYPDHNTVIAPMNTKLSTVGAGLYASDNTNAQLCYAPAQSYNPHYSAPGDDCLFMELSFGAFAHSRSP